MSVIIISQSQRIICFITEKTVLSKNDHVAMLWIYAMLYCGSVDIFISIIAVRGWVHIAKAKRRILSLEIVITRMDPESKAYTRVYRTYIF